MKTFWGNLKYRHRGLVIGILTAFVIVGFLLVVFIIKFDWFCPHYGEFGDDDLRGVRDVFNNPYPQNCYIGEHLRLLTLLFVGFPFSAGFIGYVIGKFKESSETKN